MPSQDQSSPLIYLYPLKNDGIAGHNGRKRIVFLLFSLSFLLLLASSVTIFNDNSLYSSIAKKNLNTTKNKKNLIFFVTDGMGPASLSMARSFYQFEKNLPYYNILHLDHHLIGSSRTRSNSSLVTDSAAGATAFSCGLKSYNGAIGVDPFKNPCGTILEAAKLSGYSTGLVVTTRLTDATPASFSSHVDYRVQEDQIALQQLGHYSLGPMVDLLMGGGRTHFYTGINKFGSFGSRKDNRNLIKESIANGWSYAGSRNEFDSLKLGENVTLPFLGLFADYDIPFEIDRDPHKFPSLYEQTVTALTALSKHTENSDKGFFIMIEGSRIDHAGHQNDPAAQVREVLGFDDAFRAAIEFANNSDVETVIISTSDHETGGLVTSRQVTKEYPEYEWFPKVLSNSKHSGEYLKKKLVYHNFNGDLLAKRNYIKNDIFESGLGIFDYTENDINEILGFIDDNDIQDKLNEMVSVRAEIGWTTHGHSAVDVNIYAYANREKAWFNILSHLQGNHENIEIGKFMADYLDLDLDHVTGLIKDVDHSPPSVIKEELESGIAMADEYHKVNYQSE
ncbi:hypothetical protein Kpol_1031p79 [Vanderwaltozyma polyspora DSM 70294]|uniref:Alkaline phosphatase n=1 Tax=Vanderwaltozyma polyspora (strain ATCC 22028 / DSM 70294 / BCRC 21397 / CBS 2163 / NBRC 10782 / NRRL Y-8283 / UCD 57-17) TaxID=436907 RepID=A7TI09_VANPO|nr:uncharacterized protein Kpol_1031p79 [Vanderwaltozyma polyspora DSM 70294]EDO18171.1 hypothetical protein Kpol_1031p79 [Vanderwaltozyma polyspora DSM 70294]